MEPAPFSRHADEYERVEPAPFSRHFDDADSGLEQTDCYFLVRSIRSIASQHAAQVRNGAYVLAAQHSVVASFGRLSVRRN